MYIFILSKGGPHPSRSGSDEEQDWYANLLTGANLYRENYESKIILASAFKLARAAESELDCHQRVLIELGVLDNDIIPIKQGYETTEQLTVAIEFARTCRQPLVIVATKLHMPRVKFLALNAYQKGLVKRFYTTFTGLTRPEEERTDKILNLIFPVLYRLHIWDIFLWWKVIPDRKAGRL